MSDPFDDVIPSRRGTGGPAPSSTQRQPREPDRVDLLLAALGEYDDAAYFQREEFFEDNFERLLAEHKLAVNWQAKLVQGVREEVGLLLELRPVELAPDGPLIGRLLIRWEDAPFATLLAEAPDRG
jgi:hypothetical protein